LKPEQWGTPLVQEKYVGEKACDNNNHSGDDDEEEEDKEEHILLSE
jgi:hypothetical protein